MFDFFLKYTWKNGRPKGVSKIKDSSKEPLSYKIVHDPYYKFISLEMYRYGQFKSTLYDSKLLDFRKLDIRSQRAWQSISLDQTEEKITCLIKDEDDRAVYLEKHLFEKDLCRLCKVYTCHGIHIATHKMFYRHLNDLFDGVILYDCQNNPVMQKIYEYNPQSRGFEKLISENWEIKPS